MPKGFTPLAQGGSCSHSLLTPSHQLCFSSPPTPDFLCISHRSCMVGIPFPWFSVGVELSMTFAKYLSISIMCILSGNAFVRKGRTLSSFPVRKSSGRCYSRLLSQVFGPILAISTSLALCPFARLQVHPLPQLEPSCPLGWQTTTLSLWLAPYCCSTIVDLRLLYKNAALLRPAFLPSLILLCHSPREPLFRDHSILSSSPAIRHRLVHRHRSGTQLQTLTS